MLFYTISILAITATLINAQAALPNVDSFPAACSTACSSIIEVGVLCVSEYEATDIAACFCNGNQNPTSLSTCTTCLESNNESSLSTSLSNVIQTCQVAKKECTFECGFETCKSEDIECQCSIGYLQDILDCASCNTANNNVGSTVLSDYNALKDSCVNQNYTETPTATLPLPSPTGQDTYSAPSLTAASSVNDAVSATGGTTIPISASATSKIGSISTATPISGSGSGSGSASRSGSTSSSASSSTSTSTSSALIGVKLDLFGRFGFVAVSIGTMVVGAVALL